MVELKTRCCTPMCINHEQMIKSNVVPPIIERNLKLGQVSIFAITIPIALIKLAIIDVNVILGMLVMDINA